MYLFLTTMTIGGEKGSMCFNEVRKVFKVVVLVRGPKQRSVHKVVGTTPRPNTDCNCR